MGWRRCDAVIQKDDVRGIESGEEPAPGETGAQRRCEAADKEAQSPHPCL